MKEGDKVTIYNKTYLSSFSSNLTKEGLEVGLDNILPVTGRIYSFASKNNINIMIDNEFHKYFHYSNLCFNINDFVDNKWFKDEDFII